MVSGYLCALPTSWFLFLALPLTGIFAAEVGQSHQPPRTWSSADGKFHVRATLVEAGEVSVLLEKESGGRVTVPLPKLSPADLAYVAERSAVPVAGHAAEPADASTRGQGAAATADADKPKALSSREFREQYVAFLRRTMRDAYQKVGKTNPAWDEAALKLIDAAALAQVNADCVAVQTDPPATELQDMEAPAEAVRKAGCDDPFILSLCLDTLSARCSAGKLDPAAVLKIVTEVEKRGYPPLVVAATAQRLQRVLAPRSKERANAAKFVAGESIEAISSKESSSKDPDAIDKRLSKSILEGCNPSVAAKAYRDLAVNLTEEKHKFAAQVAAAMAWHLDQNVIDHETIKKFARGASGDDFARVLRFDDEVPTLSDRKSSPLVPVKLSTDVPERSFQMVADPQGRYAIVLVEGLRGYYLVRTEGELEIKKVPFDREIGCGCLVDGRLFLVPLGKSKLIEVEPESGKTVASHSLGQHTTQSIAVFPRHGVACFTQVASPIPFVHKLALETDRITETALHGHEVAGDPGQRFLFCILQSPNSTEKAQVAIGRHVVRTRYFPGSNDYGASTLFRAAVVPNDFLISDVLDHVAASAGRICLSPDGNWLGVPAHEGWLPAERFWKGPTGQGMPVFSAHRLDHVVQFFPRKEFCDLLAVAYNPVTSQIALVANMALVGQNTVEIAQLGKDKIEQTIRLPTNGVCTWSGNGEYFLIAGREGGLSAYRNPLSDADKQFARRWWKALRAKPITGERK